MQSEGTSAQLSTPLRIGIVVLIVALGVAYFLLTSSVNQSVRGAFLDQWALSNFALATTIRNGIADSVNGGQDIPSAFEQHDFGAAIERAGRHAGIALLQPDMSLASWSRSGRVPANLDLTGYVAVDLGTGDRAPIEQFVSESRSAPFAIETRSGERLQFAAVTSRLHSQDWSVVLFCDLLAANELGAEVRMKQNLAFLALALLLLVLLLAFYVSFAGALTVAVRGAASLESAGRRFQERAGEMRAPLNAIQGLADMLVITEDPDERDKYLSELKDEIRRMSAELQAYQGVFGG